MHRRQHEKRLSSDSTKLGNNDVVKILVVASWWWLQSGLLLACQSLWAIPFVIGSLGWSILLIMCVNRMFDCAIRFQANQKPEPPFECRYLDTKHMYNGACVYLIRDLSITGYFKIGFSNSLPRRIGELSDTKLPVELDLRIVHYIPTSDPCKVEMMLHRRFRHKRVRGEWFDLDPHDVSVICSMPGDSVYKTVQRARKDIQAD